MGITVTEDEWYMAEKSTEIEYILRLMKIADRYPVFKIPGAIRVGGQFVMLHDTYTHLNIVPRSDYEKPLSREFNGDEAPKSFPDGINIALLDDFIKKIPRKGVIGSSDSEKEKNGPTTNDNNRSEKKEIGEIKRENFGISDNRIAEFSSNEDKPHENETTIVHSITSGGIESSIADEYVIDADKYQLFLSAPGGGKTTLLKMFVLAYGYRYLQVKGFNFLSDYAASIMIDDFDECKNNENYQVVLEQYSGKISEICEKLGVGMNDSFPIFLEIRDFNSSMDEGTDFEDFLKNAIKDVFYSSLDGSEDVEVVVNLLYKKINNIVLIIDSIEELIRPGSKALFIDKLLRYVNSGKKNVTKVILSSRYKEYQDFEHDQEKDETSYFPLKCQFVIKELYRDFELIAQFAKKWFASLAYLDSENENIQTSFIEPLRTNEQALNLITNPLELTSMLLISVSDRFLPSDLANLYGRSIELWFTWANRKKYNLDDVMIQMSHVAYQMAESATNRITIDRDGLANSIMETRSELKRYFKQEWASDEKSIAEFIDFLCDSHLIIYSGGTYEFFHRMYQAYFVAYCIKNNLFSREKRKRIRFEYIDEHIRNEEEFWNSIILLIAILDIDLRDEIIEELLKHARDSFKNSWYCLSILMQLLIVPGINFDEKEIEQLFTILARDNNTPKYISRKRQDICKVLLTCSEGENDIFVNVIINEYDSLDNEKDKDDYRNAYATSMFFCIWNCRVSDQSISRALKAFFPNFINTNIVSELYNSRPITEGDSERLRHILYNLGRESIAKEKDPISDYYMLIAAISAYAFDGVNPYDITLSLIESSESEKQLIAANILVIASWLIKTKDDKKFGYSHELLRGKERIIANFLNRHIAAENNLFRRDCIAAYLDFYGSENISNLMNLLEDKDTFISCAKLALDGWRDKEKDNKREEYSYELEYIATYPWNVLDKINTMFTDEEEKKNFVEYINMILKNSRKNDYKTKLEGLKLLGIININGQSNMVTYARLMEDLIKNNSYDLRRTDNWVFSQRIVGNIGENKENVIKKQNVAIAEDIIRGLGFDPAPNFDSSKDDFEYVDYYSQGDYLKAKKQYLMTFENLASRNNLAYMLRRGEIDEVTYNGITYDVAKLLQQGIQENEPYSIMNYALFISFEKGIYLYNSGLAFLEKHKGDCNLLSVTSWWLKLKRQDELEGYMVISWLCDLGLYDFEISAKLKERMQLLFKGKIIF